VSATYRSPGRSGAIDVVVSGCIADVLRTVDAPATFHHVAYRAVAKECPPASLSIISPIISSITSSIIIARVFAVFRETSMRHTQLYPRHIFASIGNLGTRSRRRRAR
jgi:hypothetical protein